MRIRTIKPGFWKSLPIAALSLAARHHFIGLWNYADDAGRGIDEPRLLKGELWPLDDKMTISKVAELQEELARERKIIRYTDGQINYFQVAGWEHQKIDHPKPSDYPGPDHPDVHPLDSPSVRSLFDEPSTNVPGNNGDGSPLYRKGREGKGKGVGSQERTPEAARLCQLLADLIEANGSKRPAVSTRWLDEADKLIRLDLRPVAEAEDLMRWCQADPFWRSNVLSMVKFRAKYDTLRLQHERPADGKGSPAPAAWDRTAG